MNKFGSTDPHAVSIPSADITSMEVDRQCHIYVNGRELPECETYDWFEAAMHEKAARERLDENGLARCGCGGKAIMLCDLEYAVACEKCLINLPYAFDTKELARQAWNTAMCYTAPPRPGAFGPEQDRTAPIGDKGAGE